MTNMDKVKQFVKEQVKWNHLEKREELKQAEFDQRENGGIIPVTVMSFSRASYGGYIIKFKQRITDRRIPKIRKNENVSLDLAVGDNDTNKPHEFEPLEGIIAKVKYRFT